MPDDATIDDIMYILYVQKKVELGINDFDNGNVLTNEQAKLELEEWLK